MPCYHPLEAWSIWQPYPLKPRISFNPMDRHGGKPLTLPCGQCIGCRLERSRQWAVRCSHEASCWSSNCFITLTYSDYHLPDDRSLNVKHFQDFMKRLRKRFSGVDPIRLKDGSTSYPIRFFHCGEYGEKLGRPHYHACLFNFDFPDKTLWRRTKQGHPVWRSKALEELWPFGMSEVGSVTFESAAYVARYITKKVTGKDADDHYFDPDLGLIVRPEYTTMSRRPGIGAFWFEKYSSDVFPHDSVVVRGREMRPPRFYDNLYAVDNEYELDIIKIEREKKFSAFADDNTPDRLLVKETIAKARLNRLPRTIK